MRTLVVRCADWPVVAAGVPLDEPAAVFHANRVVATSPRGPGRGRGAAPAPAGGAVPLPVARRARPRPRLVTPGPSSRRRRPRRPHPRVEITAPGQVAFPTRGPSRFFGGDDALVATRPCHRQRRLGRVDRVGVESTSDRPRRARGHRRRHLRRRPGRPRRARPTARRPAGGHARLPGPAAQRHARPARAADVLVRLGLRTLGALAALPERDVLARFGVGGPGRLATGRGPRRATPGHRPAPDRPHRAAPSSTRRPTRSPPPPSWPAGWPTSCTTGCGPGARPAPGW